MKYSIISLLVLLFSFASCNSNTEQSNRHGAQEDMHGHEEETIHDEHNHDEHMHESEQIGDSHEESHSDEIILDVNKAKEAGVKVSKIHMAPFNGIIKVTGEILPTRENEVSVVATVSGTVNFSSPLIEGTNISKDKPLFTINSSKIEGGDISEKAIINYEIAKKEYNRIKSLYDEKIVSEGEFNAAKQSYEEARINYEAIGKNMTEKGHIVTAPISGFVKNCIVKQGDYVQAGQPLMIIAHDSNLYLKAEIPERYYNEIYNICGANFRTAYDDRTYDIDKLGGKIISRGKASDGNSFYIPVTFSFRNTGNIIAGSYVEVFLKTSQKKEVISLPLTAITEEQGTYFIYKQLDATCYKKAEVTLGSNDGVNVEIKSGVTDGENVVTEGAYQVKLASAVSSIPAHNHEH